MMEPKGSARLQPHNILTNLKLSDFFAAPGATCSLRFQVL